EKAVDRAVVEYAGWYCARQDREEFEHAASKRVSRVLRESVQAQRRKRRESPPVFGERGAQEDIRLEERLVPIRDEDAVHLRRRDTVRQRSCHETAGRHTDIN